MTAGIPQFVQVSREQEEMLQGALITYGIGGLDEQRAQDEWSHLVARAFATAGAGTKETISFTAAAYLCLDLAVCGLELQEKQHPGLAATESQLEEGTAVTVDKFLELAELFLTASLNGVRRYRDTEKANG